MALEKASPELLELGPGPVVAAPWERVNLDLHGILRILRVRKKVIIGTAFAVVAITAIVEFRMTPLYDASSIVMLDERQNKVVDINAALSGLPMDRTEAENQLEILRSRNLVGRVVDKLHLDQEPQPTTVRGSGDLQSSVALQQEASPIRWFSNVFDWVQTLQIWTWASNAAYYTDPQHWFAEPPNSPETEQEATQKRREQAISGLLGGLTVTDIGRSLAMRITFQSPDPSQAALVADTIADAYVEDQLDAKFDATKKTSQWLADRLQTLSQQVQAADVAVQEYKAQNNITSTQGGGTIVDEQLAQINGQLITARSALSEAEARYGRVRQLRAAGRIGDVSQVVQSGLIGALVAQESTLTREEADLSTKYGPRHPKMLEVQAQMRDLRSRISQEVARVVETVANDVAVASAHVSALQQSLRELESENRVESKAKVKLSELQAQAASAHQLYEAFLGKFKETQGQESIQTPDARVISRATVPSSPVIPRISLSLELALVGGLVLGFMLALLIERLDAGFRTVAQVEQMLRLPVLSTLPDLGKSRKHPADRIIDKPLSAFSEAMRGLQMGLILSNVDRRPKVILVTSSAPYEGKTTVALSLARVAARGNQRVLLMDADLRQPGLTKLMSRLPKSEKCKGLIEILSGEAAPDECLIADTNSNALILPTSRVVGNPPDLLGSAAMENLIERLRNVCDLLIIDSAPLLAVNDSKVLARLADAVLLVVRWETTPREAVIHAARSLVTVGAHVAGIVLTRAHPKRYRYYSYGYQNQYHYDKYYSD